MDLTHRSEEDNIYGEYIILTGEFHLKYKDENYILLDGFISAGNMK